MTCEKSSSGQVSAEGLGIFVLLSLSVELLVVLKCSFSKRYSKKTLLSKLMCHESASLGKTTLKRTKNNFFESCLCFLLPL